MKKPVLNSDFKLGSVLLLFCLWVWFYAIPFQIKGTEQQLYPRFATLFIAVPSAMILIRGIKAGVVTTKGSRFIGILLESRRSLAVVGMMFAYATLLNILGYFSASFLAILAFLLFMGVRRPLPLAVTPVAMLGAVHLLIERLLQFPLPDGVLF